MSQPVEPSTSTDPPPPTQVDSFAESSVEPDDPARLPSLGKDPSFWGLTTTQFLGAFNDNLYKQLVLLLFVAVPHGAKTQDFQGVALLMYSLPFILFSGFAGYLSDRYSKTRVIVLAKLAEVIVMASGVAAFYASGVHGMTTSTMVGMSVVLFCMGAHSAFFGPGKYGILPELFRERDLPAANGIVLMTTFLAIIFGSALAGGLMELWSGRLWAAGLVCVGIAVVGVTTSLLIRKRQAAAPQLPFEPQVLFIPREIRRLLAEDKPLRQALIASIIFWTAAAIVQPAVNALGKRQLGADDFRTSILVTVISIGIASGSVLAGFASRGTVNAKVQRIGAWGMIGTLAALSLRGGLHDHLLGYYGTLVALIILGMFTGMFAVPLQVFLQSRPPAADKGRLIATQNLLNWIGIFASSGMYVAADWVLDTLNWPNNGVFALTALLLSPVGFWYRPAPQQLKAEK